MDGAELGEVLERHLRGPVLPDRDAGVRAAELDVRAADRRHADEVVGAAEEGGERRGEGLPAQHLHPDRGRDQLLLGDVHLEEALRDARRGRSRRRSSSRPRRRVRRRRRARRRGPRAPRRTPSASPPRSRARTRPLERRRLEAVRLARGSGFGTSTTMVADPAQLRDRLLGARPLPCQPSWFSTFGVALALDRPGDDRGRACRSSARPRGRRRRSARRRARRSRSRASRTREAVRVGREIPAVHRLAALAEPVDVDDRRQVVELVERGVLGRLPHRALGHLAVAADHPDAERQPVEPLAGERHADADRQALPERAGGHVDPGQHRASGAPRAGCRTGGRCRTPPRRGRPRRGRARRRAATRAPSRRPAGRWPGSSGRRSRSGSAPRGGRRRGRRPTSTRSDAPTWPSRSRVLRRPAAAVPAHARARARPCRLLARRLS